MMLFACFILLAGFKGPCLSLQNLALSWGKTVSNYAHYPQASTFLRKITCQQHSILPEPFLFPFCSRVILFADLPAERPLTKRRK